MTLVLDASVAIKWVLDEPGADDAARLLSRALFAPDLFQVEIGHILTKRVRRKQLTTGQARIGYEHIMTRVALAPSQPLGLAAFKLSLELQHAIHDCYYLAAAELSGKRLITADAVFAVKLRASGRGRLVHLLGEEVTDV